MYTGHGFANWGMGDIDVILVDGTYHLFHLVLPNHAYVAHAVSRDGLNWTRVSNALFIGDPGWWDDDMLWTVHVSPDPDRDGGWRMFYTGLCRKESGRVQRIGLAVSDDLNHWRKVPEGFPLTISGSHYESSVDEGRHWVSFRDPFFCQVDGERWILAAARVKTGPLIRRGCVGLLRETARHHFEVAPPLHHPRRYDDVEVPNLLELDGRYYLIGSIREDVKVHYWQSDNPEGPYGNFFDNVLLPQGNYAARICRDGERVLLWNFYFKSVDSKSTGNMLPPPKELFVTDNGQLKLRSFSGFDSVVKGEHTCDELTPLRIFGQHPSSQQTAGDSRAWFGCENAFEIFLLCGRYTNFRMRCTVEMEGTGKWGFVIHLNENTDGYFISMDLIKGLVQCRAWGERPDGGIEGAFRYEPLQSNFFVSRGDKAYDMELISFGKYIELSIDGYVMLSLADDTYEEGLLGFYTESVFLRLSNLTLEELDSPRGEDYESVV
jgi:beta-fructofuranosidase